MQGVSNPYEDLAIAIIRQAVWDYQKAIKIANRPIDEKTDFDKRRKAQGQKRALERFFRSDWGKLLSGIDGELIIQEINRQEGGKRYDMPKVW